MAASDTESPIGWRPDRVRSDSRRSALVLALVLGVSLATGCRSGSDRPTPSSDPPAPSSAQNIADTAADRCGPHGSDRLYADAHTRDPATAARWYADTVERDWQALAEEACYLALLSATP